MEQTRPVIQKILRVTKALLAAYILTAVCLIVLAFLLLKLDLSEAGIHAGIIVTYLLSCFAGGFILGKTMGTKKYLWGLALGITYFLIAFLISTIAFHGNPSIWSQVLISMLLCMGGGMAGGMIS